MVLPDPYAAPVSNENLNIALEANNVLQDNQDLLAEVQRLLGTSDPLGTTNTAKFDGENLTRALGPNGNPLPIQALVLNGTDPLKPIVLNQNVDWFANNAGLIKYYSFVAGVAGVSAPVEMTYAVGDPVILSGGGDDLFNLSGSDALITILGGGGDDTILTGTANDSISGDAGDDFIIANYGDDSISAGEGFDTIDGGSGWDVVYLQGIRSDFTSATVIDEWFSLDNNSGFVTEPTGPVPSADYGVLTENVEFISLWSEGSVQNWQGGGLQNSFVLVDNDNDLLSMRMYQALLDRSADSAGADYWLNTSADTNAVEVANSFLESDEFAEWGALTNEEYITLLYRNTFHREDVGQEAMDYWLGDLSNGQTWADVAVSIVASAEADQTVTNVIQVSSII